MDAWEEEEEEEEGIYLGDNFNMYLYVEGVWRCE